MYVRSVASSSRTLAIVLKSHQITCASRRCFSFHPVTSTAELFQLVHTYTHLPWWALIMVSTVSLRSIITLPLAIHQHKLIAKMELIQPTVAGYKEAVKHKVISKCRRENLPVEEANRRLKRETIKMVHKLYYYEGCHPAKMMLLPWVQIPIWVVISLSLRDISGIFPGCQALPVSSLATEGVLWFKDLSKPDSYGILPVLLAGTNLINIELHALRRQSPSRLQRTLSNTFRVLSVVICVVAMKLPTAMTLYWATSSTFGLLQNIILRFPKVRRKVGIPLTPSESQHPFKDLAGILNEKRKSLFRIKSKAE